ncbi:MAG: LysR family transcriptional regulator, partial [Ardenticatenaceae bacterium]
MELNHLRTFIAVAEERNVTKAARRLFMTPPSVSAQIKALERELKVTLFVRSSKGMSLTEKGAILKVKAEQTLQAAQALLNSASDLQSDLMGRVTVGLNASASFLQVPQLTKRLRTRYAGIQLAFVNSVSGHILQALRNGTLDAGYVFGDIPDPKITASRLFSAELVVAAPKAWEEQIRAATWQQIARLPWIHSDSYCPFQNIIDDLFQHKSPSTAQKKEPITQSSDERTKYELVCAGVGITLLEKSEAQEAQRAGKLLIWQTDPIYCDLFFAHLNTRRNDPLIKALTAEVMPLWNGELRGTGGNWGELGGT